MKLSDFCIKRPVFATVINLLVMLAGIMTFKMLTVREFPNVAVPVVNVETYYEGANASIVESQITQKLEESLSGIEGVDYMSSNTVDERSQVTIRFKPSRNIDDASNDDVIAVIGKGDETYQIVNGEYVYYKSDVKVAEELTKNTVNV